MRPSKPARPISSWQMLWLLGAVFCAACQARIPNNEPGIPALLQTRQQSQITITPNTVKMLTATPHTTVSATSSGAPADIPSQVQTVLPASETPASHSPLAWPFLVDVRPGGNNTILQVGFEFLPGLRRNPGMIAEIYDAWLWDQDGREYPLASTTTLAPRLAEAEFSELDPQAQELTLKLEYSVRNLPADQPLVIDLDGHTPGQSWPIQAVVSFDDLQVPLHSASLLTTESGPPGAIQKIVLLELHGSEVTWRGTQLICLALQPAVPARQYETACGQEAGGIMTSISLGEPVSQGFALPLLPASVQFQVTGDFLILDPWETKFPISP